MSDYVRQNDFSVKDALPSGSALKIIRGTDVDAEFDALVSAVASKLDDITAATTGNVPLIGSSGATLTDSGYDINEIKNPYIDVIAYGATGDGTTDDTVAIQAAFDAVQDGGAIYFPKAGGGYPGPSYKITAQLTLSKNDVTVFSAPRAEFSEGIKSSAAIDMILVTGYGVKFQNMTFYGNGSTTAFGTNNGIVINRSSLGDDETYSNLDCEIKDCGFLYLNDCIVGHGRNVFIFDNIFSVSKRGVVGNLHTYDSGASTSAFRGWRINRNRFHSMGNPYISTGSAVTVPASISALDSWCIQMPQTSNQTVHLEILGNNSDLCGSGFYKGYLAGAKISGNIWAACVPIFVYANITDADNQSLGDLLMSTIELNTLNNLPFSAATRGVEIATNCMIINNVRNLSVIGNICYRAYESIFTSSGCNRLKLNDNVFYNGNLKFSDDATTRPCVSIASATDVKFMQNDIVSQTGTVYSYGLSTSSVSGIKIRDNTIKNAVDQYNVAASDIATAEDEGLAWQSITPLNGYSADTYNRGIRRLFDGTVQVEVHLTGGADNVVAFQLPVGYRPVVSAAYPAVAIWNTDTSTEAYAFIAPSGDVKIDWKGLVSVGGYLLRFRFEAA